MKKKLKSFVKKVDFFTFPLSESLKKFVAKNCIFKEPSMNLTHLSLQKEHYQSMKTGE